MKYIYRILKWPVKQLIGIGVIAAIQVTIAAIGLGPLALSFEDCHSSGYWWGSEGPTTTTLIALLVIVTIAPFVARLLLKRYSYAWVQLAILSLMTFVVLLVSVLSFESRICGGA
jgi:hypothetical protein